MELQAAFDVLLTSDSALDGLDALIWQVWRRVPFLQGIHGPMAV